MTVDQPLTIAILMMKSLSEYLIIFFTLFLVTSCSMNPKKRKELADSIATNAQFTPKLVKGDKFLIYTYQKITDPSKPYEIYIEGDGYIFYDNPTPMNPMLIRLATLDSRPNIIYIARPCQYTIENNQGVCNASYWTTKRMSEDSVNAITEVINKVTAGQYVDLIGFSGGGGIAALVAARDHKVRSIITIAGNLNHKAFNDYHGSIHMTESLNPIDYAQKINKIPQLHLSGSDDKSVPPFIAEEFIKKSNSPCVHNKTFEGFTHSKGWDSVWKSITQEPIKCY